MRRRILTVRRRLAAVTVGARRRGRLSGVRRSAAALSRLGLRPGEPIRFRRRERGRWIVGKVVGIAADGSITLHDPDGSARSLRPERVEIRRPGSRGRLRWRVVSDVVVTWEQLELFDDPPAG